MPSIDEIYVEIKLLRDQVKSDLAKFQSEVEGKARGIQDKLKFQARFDSSLAKLKISELQSYRQKLQTLFDKQLKLDVDSATLDRTRQKLASVQSALSEVDKQSNQMSGMFGKIGSSIGAAFATGAIVRFGFEAVTLAGKVQGIKTAFDNLNQPGLLENLRAATRNTVSDFELMKVAMRAANFKIPLTELSTLLEFAQKRAQQTGQEVDYLVNSIIDGIGRKSTLVLDNLGISATELQTEFAKTGDFGKATANIISREMKNMGDVIDTSATKLAQLNAQLENQKVEIGNQLTPIWSGLLKVFGGGLSVLSAMGQEFKRSVSPARYYGEIIEGLIIKHRQYAAILEKTYISQAKLSSFIVSTYKQQRDTIGQINQRISDLKAEQENLVYGSDEYLKNVKEIEKLEKSIGLGKVTAEMDFTSNIPSGYTAQQVAEFEKLKFAVQDYVDFRTAQIENTFKHEIEKARGNAVEIAKAEENKLLAYARFNQEIIDLQKEGSDATNKIVSDSLKERERELELDIEQEAQIEAEGYKNRQDAIDNYYKQVQKKDEDYYAWKLLKIAEETKAIQEATDNKILAEKYRIEQQQELEQEYFDWKVEQWREQNKIQAVALDSMVDGLTNAFGLIKIRTKESASALELVFVEMANSFIAQVQRMAAEWLAFQLLKGAVGGILAPFTGGASLAIPALKQGGEFFRGRVTPYSQIPKFATGTEFNVPSKFTNDSFLMRVSGDERVKVTPANKVGDTEKLLYAVTDKLDILNANLVSKSFAPVINNSLELDGRKVTKAVYKTMTKMQKEGRVL